ncbi:LytTR family DNA-binding domain-containing protein [Nibrella viscosa]|uniref:LytTR family DNA-binding domain-containing protein n=1 Tax=Nibrella viscosa TaxID=1084524 RepID=A0ABP8KPG1_9BACT
MLRILKQPYPIEEAGNRLMFRIACIGAFVGLFLLLFQPFGLSLWQTEYKTLKILGFGLITFVITAFNYFVWPAIWPRQFSDERWTVGREIALVLLNILLIALGNMLYMTWMIGHPAYVTDLVSAILITFLVGIFPVAGSIIFNYIVQLKKYSRTAAEAPVHEPKPVLPSGEQPLVLLAENEKDTVTVKPSSLLYIESSDNYSTIVTDEDGRAQKTLLRSSLSRLEGQITHPAIVRCHRSYIVNLDRVEKVTGNAQGYKLHMLNAQHVVPVARKYNDSFISRLKATA